MVDIVIGQIQPLGPANQSSGSGPGGTIEAEILDVRSPRKDVSGPRGKERRRRFRRDPPSAQVLTILVPHANLLPKDLDKGRYKVLLRFVKKG